MKETELYVPVKCFLESLGYIVKGEVGVIDVFAMRKDESIAVELKNSITLKLIYQAIERQKVADDVYIAIPTSALKSHQLNYRSFILLLRRLEVGLMIVSNDVINIVCEPKFYDLESSKKRNKKKHAQLINEFKNRNNDLNIGGSKEKRLTVYREKAIAIAKILFEKKIMSPKQIKESTGIIETQSILQKNYYGWFNRVSLGRYELTEYGKTEVKKYDLSY